MRCQINRRCMAGSGAPDAADPKVSAPWSRLPVGAARRRAGSHATCAVRGSLDSRASATARRATSISSRPLYRDTFSTTRRHRSRVAKSLRGINARGVFPQLRLHQADIFEDSREVEPRPASRRLPNAFEVETVSAASLVCWALTTSISDLPKLLFDPVLRRAQRHFLILKLLRQRCDEVRLARDRLGFKQVQDISSKDIAARARAGSQAVRPQISRLAQLLAPADPHREARQCLDQRDAQEQGESPQLRDRQSPGRLKLRQTAADAPLSYVVTVFCNQLLGERVDGRRPLPPDVPAWWSRGRCRSTSMICVWMR